MKRPELLIETGELAGRRYAVGYAGLRLGRSSSNDIQVCDEALSRNHCMFEVSGESSIRVTDLASANGTLLNGKPLGPESLELKVGDVIAIGDLRIRVVSADDVDLGLAPAHDGSPASPERRAPFMNALWIVAVLSLALSIYLVLVGSGGGEEEQPTCLEAAGESDRVEEMRYEKVVASGQSIFRYSMVLDRGGSLRVAIDDVPGENRHVDRTQHLGEQALARLNEILLDQGLRSLDRQYVGPDLEPPELNSRELVVVYSSRVLDVSVVNTQEPEAFRRVSERLETFAKSELGVWAIQCTRAQLEEMAAGSAEIGRMKWEDRDVEYGNLDASVRAYREAVFYLDTLDPKPPEHAVYRDSMELSRNELDRRCSEQRFKADRALNLSDWETARTELRILCQMVPDRDDDRNREATAKLLDVEKRLKRNGGR